MYTISPFNFTAIAGNLHTSATLMGNVVVWKPRDCTVFSAKIIIDLLHEAGFDNSVEYLIEPTLVLSQDPCCFNMETKLFGPLVTVYIYLDTQLEKP